MPEHYDKDGPPKLWAIVTCLAPECGAKGIIEPYRAEGLAAKLAAGYGIRYMVSRLRCQRCGARNASLAFHIAYPQGSRPKNPAGTPDARGWPWVGRAEQGRKVAE